MHEGAVSTRLGLAGQPAHRGGRRPWRATCSWPELTRGRLHVAHLSTARALELVRRAKADGLAVTCEVTPHHLVLTDEEVGDVGLLDAHQDESAAARGVGPRGPRRRPRRRHDRRDRDRPRAAPRRREGRRLRLGALRDRRSRDRGLGRPRPAASREARSRLERFVALFSAGPARPSGFRAGRSPSGSPADVTLFDPDARWKVDPQRFLSKGRSTPFAGWELVGRARRDDRRRDGRLAEGRALGLRLAIVRRRAPLPAGSSLASPAFSRAAPRVPDALASGRRPARRTASRRRRGPAASKSRARRRASSSRSRRRASRCRRASTSCTLPRCQPPAASRCGRVSR